MNYVLMIEQNVLHIFSRLFKINYFVIVTIASTNINYSAISKWFFKTSFFELVELIYQCENGLNIFLKAIFKVLTLVVQQFILYRSVFRVAIKRQ